MTRFKLLIAYDGRPFRGWQRQTDNVPTVQGRIEAVMQRLNAGKPLHLSGASRTDAGVHAEGQVAVFDYEGRLGAKAWLKGLNALVPSSITVRSVEDAPFDFEPRFDSWGKHYRYWLWQGTEIAPPLLRPRCWEVFRALDMGAMQEGAQHLLGEHDFSAFRDAHCQASSTVRRIDAITFTPAPASESWVYPRPSEEGRLWRIDFHGSAFLKYMIRIIVGTLVQVGSGQRKASAIADILASGDRRRAGLTAPPEGLTLVEVFYPPDDERRRRAAKRAEERAALCANEDLEDADE